MIVFAANLLTKEFFKDSVSEIILFTTEYTNFKALNPQKQFYFELLFST